MRKPMEFLRSLIFDRLRLRSERARRTQKARLLCESLEGRVTPAHFHGVHQAIIAVYGNYQGGQSQSAPSNSTAAAARSAAAAETSNRSAGSSGPSA